MLSVQFGKVHNTMKGFVSHIICSDCSHPGCKFLHCFLFKFIKLLNDCLFYRPLLCHFIGHFSVSLGNIPLIYFPVSFFVPPDSFDFTERFQVRNDLIGSCATDTGEFCDIIDTSVYHGTDRIEKSRTNGGAVPDPENRMDRDSGLFYVSSSHSLCPLHAAWFSTYCSHGERSSAVMHNKVRSDRATLC